MAHTSVRALVIAVIAIALSLDSRAQQAPNVIRGRVVAAENAAALPRAHIAVSSDGEVVQTIFADDQGRFTFPVPDGGLLDLSVSKAGFVPDHLTLTPSKLRDELLQVPLTRAAVIVGHVSDATGEPLLGIRVTAARVNPPLSDGARIPARVIATTDDLGEYRFRGLVAGRYRVAIGSEIADTLPVIDLRAGDEVGPIDLIGAPRRPLIPSFVGHRHLAQGGATISGRILSNTKRPIAGALVRAVSPGESMVGAMSDAQGRYAIEGVSEGSYTIEATMSGYVRAQYGQTRASEPGLQVAVHDRSEIIRDIEMTMSHGSAVSGTITDERGEPIEGVMVRALQVEQMYGRTIAMSMPGANEGFTDDRGRYRLSALAPGSYLIAASVDATISGATARGYAPLFYPGSTQAIDAVPVRADLGRDVSAVDIVFHQVPAARVTGITLDESNEPINAFLVLIASSRSGGIALYPQTGIRSKEDGSFTIPNVPPGDYVLKAWTLQPSSFGVTFVTVGDGAPKPVVIRISTGSTLEGRLIVEAGSAREIPLDIVAMPAEFDFASPEGPEMGGSYKADGTFTKRGLFGPTRFLLGATPDWYLKSININGVDVTDVPFDFGFTNQTIKGAEVVISNEGGTISGHVTDARSMPITNYSVIVFATDRTKWFSNSRFLKFGRPAQDGGFEITGLPPGEYWVAAVDTIQGTAGNGEWEKPEVLEVLATRATRVMLAERERVMTVLRLIRR